MNVASGGTGNSNLNSGFILLGDGANPITTDSNLIWKYKSSNLFVNGGIITNNIIANYLIGDGTFTSNIITSNIKGILNVGSGGTGNNIINTGCLLYGSNLNNLGYCSNLVWNEQTSNLTTNGSLIINGDINITGDVYKSNKKYVPFNGWSNLEMYNSVYTWSNVLINYNVNDPNYMLKVNGNIYASGDITALSDEKYKNNIITIDNSLDKIEAMRGVYFNKSNDDSNKRHIGLIAQEVEKIIPEVIIESEDTGKSIAYGNLIGLLIEGIKELSNKIKILESK